MNHLDTMVKPWLLVLENNIFLHQLATLALEIKATVVNNKSTGNWNPNN